MLHLVREEAFGKGHETAEPFYNGVAFWLEL